MSGGLSVCPDGGSGGSPNGAGDDGKDGPLMCPAPKLDVECKELDVHDSIYRQAAFQYLNDKGVLDHSRLVISMKLASPVAEALLSFRKVTEACDTVCWKLCSRLIWF